MKQYVTFGQGHTHRINGVTLDADCVASFTAPDAEAGRARAFELFGRKFCFHYAEAEFRADDLRFYPRGVVDLDRGGAA